MAGIRHRRICLDHEPGHAYPYVCSGWRNVGGITAGDRFTPEVAEILIEAWREDGITVEVKEVSNAEGDS